MGYGHGGGIFGGSSFMWIIIIILVCCFCFGGFGGFGLGIEE